MKKILLFATASIFCLNLMAQDTKSQTSKVKQTKQVLKTPAGEKVIVTAAPANTATKATPVTTTAPGTAAAPANQITPDDVIKVNTETHDFGKIKQGIPVTFYFELKNISKKPVYVVNTYSSCGCTTPGKIEEPIAPGATAKLKVDYNANAKGSFNKGVHIKLGDVEQEKVVYIIGEVITDEQPAAPANNPSPAKPNN